MRSPIALAFALALALADLPALAVERCELNGDGVSRYNGSTTAGKTGLLRCREGDGGPLVSEQELRNGVFMGIVRRYSEGVLEKEYSVNAKGNREGLAREWAKPEGGGKPVLVREETLRDGSNVGIAREWFPSGQLRRVAYYGDDAREQAHAEFTAQGKLYELRCAPQPVLGRDADDGRWCGHAGGASTVVLYNGKGQETSRVSFERGERRKIEELDDKGVVRNVVETTAGGGVERTFYADGTKRREQRWVKPEGTRNGRIVTLDQEYHESGKLVRERRWQVGARGAELTVDQFWYLNGEPKQRTEIARGEDKTLRKETTFRDNGTKSSEGVWRVAERGSRGGDLAIGVHRSWDSQGRLREESYYDERGRINRERSFSESGAVVRDDELFEDGSRKALAR